MCSLHTHKENTALQEENVKAKILHSNPDQGIPKWYLVLHFMHYS